MYDCYTFLCELSSSTFAAPALLRLPVLALLIQLLGILRVTGAESPSFSVVVQTDHTAQINSIVHSDRTHQVITASNDNFLRVWSSTPGQEFGRLLYILQGHTDNVTATGIQPEGKNLVSGGRDGKLILWDLFTGLQQSIAHTGEKVVAITYSDDPYQNSIAVALDAEKSVHFFDATKVLRESSTIDIPQAGGTVTSLLAYSSWQHLACGTTAGEIVLLDIHAKRILKLRKVSTSKIISIGRMSDETLVWIDEQGSIGIVTVDSDREAAEPWKSIQTGKILSAAFDPQNKLFAFVTSKGVVESVDPITKRRSLTENQSATCAASIESGNIVVGTRNGTLQWLTRSGMRSLSTPSGANSIQRAVAAGAKSLAILNQNYDVWVWDYTSGACTYYPLPDKSGADFHLSYNDAGDRLAIGTGTSDASIQILYQDSLLSLGRGLSAVKSLKFIPGTNLLLSGHANGSLIVWDGASGSVLRQINNAQPQICISSRATQVLTTDKKTIRLRSLATLMVTDSLSVGDRVIMTAEIDSLTGMIAVGYENGDIGMWANGFRSKEILCKGHTSKVNHLRWIRDNSNSSKPILVSCSKDNSTRTWTSTGKQIASAINHFTEVWDIDILPVRNYAASVGNDGTCVVIDLKTLQPVIKLVTIAPASWIAVTPEGVFDASSSGVGAVNIVRDNHSLPLENYITLLEKPGILAQVLGASIKPTPSVLSQLNEKPIASIRILSPMSVRQFATDEALLTFELMQTGSQLKEIRVTNNGNPQYSSDSVSLRGLVTVPLQLYPGKNLLRVVCTSLDGIESYDTMSVFSTFQPQVKPNLYVLAVGVSKYKNSLYNLKYAQNDAESLSATLRDNFSKSEYSTITVKQLVNENATVSNILAGFDEISRLIQPNDRFIFYFAGHGTLSTSVLEQEFYLITHEIESLSDERTLRNTGLSVHLLQSKFLSLKCEKKALVLDACHAGAVTASFMEEQSGTTKILRQLPRTSGVYLMSAALGSQLARESDNLQHGIFTTALLEGLNGKAASMEDRQISLSTLQDYIQKRIKKLKTELQFNQTPIFRSDDTDGFVVTQLQH